MMLVVAAVRSCYFEKGVVDSVFSVNTYGVVDPSDYSRVRHSTNDESHFHCTLYPDEDKDRQQQE